MRKSIIEQACSFVGKPKCCGESMNLHEEPTTGQNISFWFSCKSCGFQTKVQSIDSTSPFTIVMDAVSEAR